MRATGWGICALTVVTAGLLGCPGSDMFTQKPPQQVVHPEDYLLDGKLEVVVDKTQGVLRQLGVQAVTSGEDGGARIVVTTASGNHLGLVLTRCMANDTLTVAHMEWQAEEDSGLGRQILDGLELAGVKTLVRGG
jgi:hypothetical protein